jgi:hypothetical protein
MTSSFDITALHDGGPTARQGAANYHYSRLISSLAPDDREHVRRIVAEIIASGRTSSPGHG